MSETKKLWIAYTNTDNTEGRGRDVPIAFCESEFTARRLAKGQYIQGADGPVKFVHVTKFDSEWLVSVSALNVIKPSSDDLKAEAKKSEFRQALEKAKAAGLSADDINAIIGIESVEGE